MGGVLAEVGMLSPQLVLSSAPAGVVAPENKGPVPPAYLWNQEACCVFLARDELKLNLAS